VGAERIAERLRRAATGPGAARAGSTYRVLASCAVVAVALAAVGAALGPRWDPQPLRDPLDPETPDTDVPGAPRPTTYPVRESVVRVALEGAGVRARILEPIGAPGPVPGVVFVHGAGTGRFTEAFVDQARLLAARGIATLVPDKRLDTYSTRHRDYVRMAGDYARSVAALRARPAVDAARVGVYGESEGCWIAPVMAATDPTLAFVALVSAPVVSPRSQAAFAMDQYLRNTGVPRAVFRAIPRAIAISLPGGGLDYADFDVQPYQQQVHCPVFVAYGTGDASMPTIQGAEQILADAAVAGDQPVTVRYYARADHGLKVDRAVSRQFVDDLAGWVLGLPGTAGAAPVVAGDRPVQTYRADPPPQALWLRDGDAVLGILVGAAGLVALGGAAVAVDRLVRWSLGRSGRPPAPGPRFAPGVAPRLAAVGALPVLGFAGLIGYLATTARLAMGYQRNAVVVQGGWLAVRALGTGSALAAVLLGRRVLAVRARGGVAAPGPVRLGATWAVGGGSTVLLVLLGYWGVFHLGI
jgi:dienelactone hydrolase